ncbi:MAG: hypothetical protein ACQERC_09395 [Bacteroidota bacterium]
MKLLLLIPLLILTVAQALHLSVSDVTKIPELLEHYQEHRENDGDSFLTFINKHYGGQKEQHGTENREDHEDLPFHHSQHVCIDMKIDMPSLIVAFLPENTIPEHYFYYEEPHTSAAASQLLQPPKNNC